MKKKVKMNKPKRRKRKQLVNVMRNANKRAPLMDAFASPQCKATGFGHSRGV